MAALGCFDNDLIVLSAFRSAIVRARSSAIRDGHPRMVYGFQLATKLGARCGVRGIYSIEKENAPAKPVGCALATILRTVNFARYPTRLHEQRESEGHDSERGERGFDHKHCHTKDLADLLWCANTYSVACAGAELCHLLDIADRCGQRLKHRLWGSWKDRNDSNLFAGYLYRRSAKPRRSGP